MPGKYQKYSEIKQQRGQKLLISEMKGYNCRSHRHSKDNKGIL
jgi:hypothetical protein